MLKMSKKEKERLADYVLEEIERSENDRADFLTNLETYTRLYEGKVYEKDFPWKDCSNVKLPFTATNCEAIFARMMNSIFAIEPFWMVKPIKAGAWEYAKNLEYFLEYASVNVLHIYDFCQKWFLPAVKYGTSPAKIHWQEDWRYYYKTEDGVRTLQKRLWSRGPKLDVIPLQDFFTPIGYNILDEMPWVSNRIYKNLMQLDQLAKDYEWENLDKVKRFPVDRKGDVEEETAEKLGIENKLYDTFEFYETYLMWNVEDKGIWAPIWCVVNPQSRQLVFVDDFPYDHGQWPFAVIRYMPRENSLYGIGVVQMLEHIQKTLDTHTNQIIDNATIANTRWFKWKKGTPLPRNLKIRPGMIVPMDDPNDLVAEQMGDTYQSNPFYIQFLMQQGERRSGLTEYSLGRESPVVGSRATATSTLALIQESNRRFDLTLRDIRNSSSEVGYQCLELWQQFTDGLYKYIWKRPDIAEQIMEALPGQQQELIQRQFDFVGRDFRSEVSIELSASSTSNNRQLEQQNYMTLFQQYAMYSQQMMAVAQQLENPQIPPTYKQMVLKLGEAQSDLLNRIMTTFDFKDARTFTNVLEEYNVQLALMAQQFAGGGSPAGPAGPPQLAPGPAPGGARPAGPPQAPTAPVPGGGGVPGPPGGGGAVPLGM